MNLGAFSVSLNVRDVEASRNFYARLGFAPIGGDADEGWLILRNGQVTLGLFKGMIEKTTLTFNPGWDQDGRPLAAFEDVREIQRRLAEAGVELLREAEAHGRGPASCLLEDPDGNPILLDQHVDRPGG